MPEQPVVVRVHGLRELRRDLKVIGATLPRELTKAQKGAGEVIASRARELAPRRSGRLAASIKVSAVGTKVSVKSSLPYANPIHWGWRARGIVGTPFIWRAIDEKRDEYVDALGDAIEALARRHGFHR